MSENPFKGASFYDESDRDRRRFFGREADGTQLFRRLLADREIILYSPSGSGKSSLLRADLMARLGDRGFLMPMTPLRPGTLLGESGSSEQRLDYDVEFWRYLFQAFTAGSDATSDPIRSAGECLARIRGGMDPEGETAPIAIVVDQTEEIFTHPNSSISWRQTYFKCLGQIARAERVWLIMAVREDFLARLLACHDLFVTELRSRYALALFDAQTVREIVEKSLACADVRLDSETLDKFTHCVLLSCLPSNERCDSKRLQTVRIIEPLFLQIFGASWWDRAEGDPEKLWQGPFTPGVIESTLIEYIDHCLAEAANSIAEAAKIQSDAVEIESRLRYWLGNELIKNEMRSPALVPNDLAAEVGRLEKNYLIHRVQLGERNVELAHDQLVGAVKRSNTNWYARTPRGEAWQAYQAWSATGEKSEGLLKLPRVLETYRGQRRPTPAMKRYLGKSLWHHFKWFGGLSSVAIVLMAMWGYFSIKASLAIDKMHAAERQASIAVSQKEKAQEDRDAAISDQKRAENARKEYFSAMRSQDLIAQAWNTYSRDTGRAASFALAARLEANDAGHRRLALLSRAEAVLGRALAAPIAVEYFDRKVGENSCVIISGSEGKNASEEGPRETVDASTASSPWGGCFRVANNALEAFDAHLELDRVHTSPEGRPRHNYSFVSLRNRQSPTEAPRRLWLSFADEALIHDRPLVIGFPSEEGNGSIIGGEAWLDGRNLRGYSISLHGRLYVWSALGDGIDRCLGQPYDEEMATENEACRILRIEGNVQLFNRPIAAIKYKQKTDAELYDAQFEVQSIGGRLVRVSLRRARHNGAPWLGEDIGTLTNDWANNFFSYSDMESIDHVWLVTNGGTFKLAPGSARMSGAAKYGRAAWCDQAGCPDGRVFWLSRDGARATFQIADGKLIDPPRKSRIADQCAPFLGQTVVLEGGALILAAGTVPTNEKTKCIEHNQGPVLAIISNDITSSTSFDATNFELLPLREVLPEEMREDAVDGLAVYGDLLGLVSTVGRAAVCRLTSRQPAKVEACHLLREAKVARGIAILGGLAGEFSEVVAINDQRGQVLFFDRDGRIFPMRKPVATAGDMSPPSAQLDSEDGNSASDDARPDPKGSALPLLLLKDEGGDIRVITAAGDHVVRMRLYTISNVGIDAGVPAVIAEMDANVRALAEIGGEVYVASERASVRKLTISAEAIRSLACKGLQIATVKFEGEDMDHTYSTPELCGDQ